jgi:hypothetical protein
MFSAGKANDASGSILQYLFSRVESRFLAFYQQRDSGCDGETPNSQATRKRVGNVAPSGSSDNLRSITEEPSRSLIFERKVTKG